MTRVPLSARSRRSHFGVYSALLDDCDAEWAFQFDWTADVRRTKLGVSVYAYRWIRDGHTRDSRKTKRYMHREVLERARGSVGVSVDHIDGNSLNNTRGNLRPATSVGNSVNTPRRFSNPSGFKGVCWHPGTRKWRARLNDRHLGLFDDPMDAAVAYDVAAKDTYGEFARLNFPDKAA